MAPHPRRAKLLHRVFALGVWVKGIDGVLEIIGGVVLLLTSNAALNRLRMPLRRAYRERNQKPQPILGWGFWCAVLPRL